jgi:hypothetical protein
MVRRRKPLWPVASIIVTPSTLDGMFALVGQTELNTRVATFLRFLGVALLAFCAFRSSLGQWEIARFRESMAHRQLVDLAIDVQNWACRYRPKEVGLAILFWNEKTSSQRFVQ